MVMAYKPTQTELRKRLQYFDPNPGYNFQDPNKPLDEGSLSDEELQNRLSDFQQLGQTQGQIDPSNIKRMLDDSFKNYGVHFFDNVPGGGNASGLGTAVGTVAGGPTGGAIGAGIGSQFGGGGTDRHENVGAGEAVKQAIAEFIQSAQRLPDVGEMRDLLNSKGLNGQAAIGETSFQNFLQDQDNKNHFAQIASGQVGAPDTKGDVKRLQDLITQRGERKVNQKTLDDFVGNLPGQLQQNTDQFYGGQRQQAQQYLQDFVDPQIRGNLGARGLLTSGDLSAELANASGEALNPIEQQYAQARQDDLSFFENAAYQTNLQKVISSSQDLSNQINFERGNALSAQQNRFQVGQQNIQDQSALSNFRRQQQSNLMAQQTQLKRQQDLQSAQGRAGMYQGIGSSIGAIGGAVIGNAVAPGIGGIIGSQAGSQFGGGTANLFSKTS